MDTYELSEMITNKILYRIGESTTIVGIFITMVGAIMMIYSDDPLPVKKNMDIDMV